MNLSFHPTHPEFPGKKVPVPATWAQYLAPWSTAIYIESDFGAVLIQELICKNFCIYIWTLDIKNAICLYPTAKTPTIAIQFTIEGNISCILQGYGNKLLEEGNYEIFYVPIGQNEAWFEPGFYESLHIELQPAYLEDLITIRAEIGDLIARLQNSSTKGMPMAIAYVNYVTINILENLRKCSKTAASLLLEMHKYILELLSEYFADILANEEGETRIDVHHRDLMIKIKKHILKAPNIHQHTVEKLSRSFGISETLLKQEFKKLYKTNISEFVRSHALDKSHYLLTTTTKDIGEIAEEVGYTWRHAFEDAFKKHFDYSPSKLRNV